MVAKMNSNLVKNIWSKNEYYKVAQEGSTDFDHPAMKKLIETSKKAKSVLDLGCGEGTRLAKLIKKGQRGYGIDISSKAISLAKKKYPGLNFAEGNLEKLPFEDESYDVVYSAFTFEHLENPKQVLGEAIRVLKIGGKLLIVAPNFGAPNRASPPFKGSRVSKLFLGFFGDFLSDTGLSWRKVEPIASAKNYEPDWDTTVEPYLGSLMKYLKKKDLSIEYYSSVWERDLPSSSILQKKIRILGKLGIYPFKLWGPHLLVIAKKVGD